MIFGMTPHFTIRVWAALDKEIDDLPRRRAVVAEIEVDTTESYDLTINVHRGLDLIPQKMLTAQRGVSGIITKEEQTMSLAESAQRLCANPDCGHHELDHGPILGCQARTEEVFCDCHEYEKP